MGIFCDMKDEFVLLQPSKKLRDKSTLDGKVLLARELNNLSSLSTEDVYFINDGKVTPL